MHPERTSSRRAFLRGGLAVVAAGVAGSALSGCGLFGDGGASTAEPPTHELDGFLTATVALGDQYDAAITAVPDLTALLTPLRDAHREHAKALAQAIGTAVPPAQGVPTPPPDRAGAIALLTSAEKTGQEQAAAACLATNGRLAPLVGSIAAARATHLEVLA